MGSAKDHPESPRPPAPDCSCGAVYPDLGEMDLRGKRLTREDFEQAAEEIYNSGIDRATDSERLADKAPPPLTREVFEQMRRDHTADPEGTGPYRAPADGATTPADYREEIRRLKAENRRLRRRGLLIGLLAFGAMFVLGVLGMIAHGTGQ